MKVIDNRACNSVNLTVIGTGYVSFVFDNIKHKNCTKEWEVTKNV